MDDSNLATTGEELPQHLLEAIHKLIQTGASHQAICSGLGLKLEEVQQVLAKATSQDSKLTESIREKSKKYKPVKNRLMTSSVMASDNSMEQSSLGAHPAMSIEQVMLSPKKKVKISEICMESSTYNTQDIQAQLHEDTLPTFIYSYKYKTEQLHRTNLVTGVQSVHRVPSYRFKFFCGLSEVPGGILLITGGRDPPVREVVRIDTRREFAVAHCSPMLTPRMGHAAVYHTPHLYVLGGGEGQSEGMCERYVCAENRWETLPPLPRACSCMSGVVVESSLYALGGLYGRHKKLDLVQKLSLESLTWDLMRLRLPFARCDIPCFKLRDTEVYLVVNKTLCSFTEFEVRPLKTLTLTYDIPSWSEASYYRRGTLYCRETLMGVVRSYEIGSLSN
jgi:hypothetical protein